MAGPKLHRRVALTTGTEPQITSSGAERGCLSTETLVKAAVPVLGWDCDVLPPEFPLFFTGTPLQVALKSPGGHLRNERHTKNRTAAKQLGHHRRTGIGPDQGDHPAGKRSSGQAVSDRCSRFSRYRLFLRAYSLAIRAKPSVEVLFLAHQSFANHSQLVNGTYPNDWKESMAHKWRMAI